MKILRNESDIKKAKELEAIIDRRRDLEKAESELKAYFKEKLEGENMAKIGAIVLVMTECFRTDLDKKKLAADNGIDFVKKYEKTTSYTKLEVKKVA